MTQRLLQKLARGIIFRIQFPHGQAILSHHFCLPPLIQFVLHNLIFKLDWIKFRSKQRQFAFLNKFYLNILNTVCASQPPLHHVQATVPLLLLFLWLLLNTLLAIQALFFHRYFSNLALTLLLKAFFAFLIFDLNLLIQNLNFIASNLLFAFDITTVNFVTNFCLRRFILYELHLLV